jgi:hypothetical protein
MNDLNEKRKAETQKENDYLKLLSKVLEKERQRFEYADTAQWLLEDKNASDMLFISEKLQEWSEKSKPENKKQFLDLLTALLRINNYCTQLEILNKSAVAKYVSEVKTNEKLKSDLRVLSLEHQKEINKLKSELESAKKEIEYINSNSK